MHPSPENTQKQQTKTTSETQVCRYCKKDLPLESYQHSNRFANGRHRICRDCRNKARRASRITQDEYKALLEAQSFACAICGISAEETARGLNVDHSHYTHKIRGLLCVQCNLGLGYFKDNTERLQAAINYLEATDA